MASDSILVEISHKEVTYVNDNRHETLLPKTGLILVRFLGDALETSEIYEQADNIIGKPFLRKYLGEMEGYILHNEEHPDELRFNTTFYRFVCSETERDECLIQIQNAINEWQADRLGSIVRKAHTVITGIDK